MRGPLRAATLSLLIVPAVAAAIATTIPSVNASVIAATDAEIVQVTVYRDRAEVIREATVRLPSGASTVEFVDIPFAVDADSLRVNAEGTPATLGAVEVRKRVEEPKETPELIAVRDEVRRLERKIATLGEEDGVDRELGAFLKWVGQVTAANQAEDLGQGRADPDAVAAIYDLLGSKMRDLATSKLDRQKARRLLQEELELARARMATLRPPTSMRSRVAAVEVEAIHAGALTLRLAYLQPGASWRPAYRAMLDAASGEVSLVAEGVVRQRTGEDWTDVELHLSSASPAKGVEPPRLMSWTLQPARYAEMSQGLRERIAVTGTGRGYQNTRAMAPGVADEYDGEQESSAIAESLVVRSAYNVAFHVPGRAEIPSDDRDHRVVLRQETLDANLVHRTVPGIDPRAFLTAVTTSPAGYPLLAGPVRVFTGGAYLGSFPLSETGPGVELTIPFGVDNRVEVVRIPEPKTASTAGYGGKNKQVRKLERTILHNGMDREVTMVLEDRLPVSEDERIVVQIDNKTTTPGYRDSERRPGVKLWTLTLAPNKKREIVLDYTVRYPREIDLPDLE